MNEVPSTCSFAAPFACSGGNVALAVGVCMSMPSAISALALEATTVAGARVGNIDDTANMAHDKVYILNGKADSTVNPGNKGFNV